MKDLLNKKYAKLLLFGLLTLVIFIILIIINAYRTKDKKQFLSNAKKIANEALKQELNDTTYFCYDTYGRDENPINTKSKVKYNFRYNEGKLVEFLISNDKFSIYFKDNKGINNVDFIKSYIREKSDSQYLEVDCEGGLGRDIKSGKIRDQKTVNVESKNLLLKVKSKKVYEGDNVEFNYTPIEGANMESLNIKCTNNQYGTIDKENNKFYINNVTENTNCTIDIKQEEYTISYDTSGSKTIINDEKKVYDRNYTISKTIPERDGYTFIAWTTKKDSDIEEYKPGDVYKENNDLSLYPIWKINNYKISLTLTGANSDSKLKSIEYGKTVTFKLTIKAGYAFGGEKITECGNAKITGTNKNERTLSIENVSDNLSCKITFITDKLSNRIKSLNTIISEKPKYNNTYSLVGDKSGIYTQNGVNFFRGSVTNNYVKFAGILWRIVSFNDTYVKLITEDEYVSGRINSNEIDVNNIYYSNCVGDTCAKNTLQKWYESTLQSYDSKILSSTYCEAARVSYQNSTAGKAKLVDYTEYTPTIACNSDGNGKGRISSKIGLLTYDELVMAGGYIGNQSNFYLNNGKNLLTMSPAGLANSTAPTVFRLNTQGKIDHIYFAETSFRPVISIKAYSQVTGEGTRNNPFVIE